MSESRLLVLLVVVVALVAYSGVLVVFLRRHRRTAVWTLICADAALAWVKCAAWLGLVFERPDFYDSIPKFGWVILITQLMQSLVLWSLSFNVLSGDRG